MPLPQTWFMQWYADPYDAQQAAARLALNFGAKNVITLTSAATSGPANIVLVRTVCGGCIVSPDAPYGWKQFSSMIEMQTEYDGHASANARGFITPYDGAFVVFWTTN